jgi:hypothetical protein
MFDSSKTGKIEKEKVRTILNTLGHTYDDQELEALLIQEDKEGEFLKTVRKFMECPAIQKNHKTISNFYHSVLTLWKIYSFSQTNIFHKTQNEIYFP